MPLRSTDSPLTAGPKQRPLWGLADADLRADHLGGLAVLRGEPVIDQVQVDLGRP